MRCLRCGLDAVFRRAYSGEGLCRSHFLNSVESRVYTTVKQHQMLTPTETIALALSGGKDSTSLLHMLVKIERRFPKARLVAVTVDEGIKGYRDEAVRIAAENCAKLGVEHRLVSFLQLYGFTLDSIVEKARARGSRLTPCTYCGVLRRKALNREAAAVGATKLATAHNLDDMVQTVVLNLFHGDLWRLSRVEPVTSSPEEGFVPRIKPLYEMPENEVALYAYLRDIEFQRSPCPYAGSSLRTEMRAIVNRMEAEHPGVKFTLLRTFEKVRPAIAEAQERAPRLNACKGCGDPTIAELCMPCQMLAEIGLH
ncbi:MAG: TIGR00269 family protein [Candidatus Bathyarchaeia archaeon]